MSRVYNDPVLQSAATATGNGTVADTAGFASALLEVQETAGGTATATVVPEGSFDGTTWYALGFQPIDAQATLTRTVTAISVTASAKHVYQVLDFYPQMRARISAIANSASINAKLYLNT